MQRELVVKGSSLGGSSDLTLLAPIKAGLVDSLESMTHKTRIKRVLGLLHAARKGAHEYAAARLLSDAVERVGVIHSVRVAVLEAEDKVLLAVSFDGPWEAYIRVLWDKVGTLLDLIFCGTEGYVTAWDHSFEAWRAWALSVHVESDFYYGPPSNTAIDLLVLRRVQLMHEHAAPGGRPELSQLRAAWPGAERATERLVDQIDRVEDDPPIDKIDTFLMARERVRQGVQALALLYRLVDLFPPRTADGPVLRRAAIELLREFVQLRNRHVVDDELAEQRQRFARPLDWLFPDDQPLHLQRSRPPLPEPYAVPPELRAQVQGGILRGYERVTHGVVLLLGFDGPAAARALLDAALPRLSLDAQPHDAAPGTVYCNLAFTAAGLRALGLDEDTLELFPEEFRQGMAARAGLLGDVRHNHPRRWRLPRRFAGIDAPPGEQAVDLTAVHAVLQLRCETVDPPALAALELTDPAHPLRAQVAEWAALAPGLQLLSAQTLRRRYRARNGTDTVVEHFGYADGEGQPELESDGSVPLANRVQLGELLWGHANASDADARPADPRQPWLFNGSFLVLRKYRQFVERLHAAVVDAAMDMQRQLGGDLPGHIETVYAKLMGRRRDGTPLLPTEAGRTNDFDYQDDPQGRSCPLRAHIRRAHPRARPAGSDRLPRLMRRGMSYGPPADDGSAADRGLVFMAYGQSLSEQFEVVQRWLAGGNSTGIVSAASCPIVGVPENGYPRVFSFELNDAAGQARVFQVQLEARTALFQDPQPPTQLEWGLYLFAPALAALQRLRAAADAADTKSPAAAVAWKVPAGLRLLQRLQALEPAIGDPPDLHDAKAQVAIQAWKAAVEDPGSIDRLYAASIWAALREHRGGVLKTSYGTLVADRELAAEVFQDPGKRYSVSGQRTRMLDGFGDIYLGLDAGAEYEAQSAGMNQAIGLLGFDAMFEAARDAATRKIDAVVAEAQQLACDFGDARFDTLLDARELMDHVLADLCEDWFGVDDQPPGTPLLQRGGTDWAWQDGQPPLYPGHFTALSRHMFQPHPGEVPRELGPRYGRALRPALRAFVDWHVDRGTLPRGPRSAAPAPLAEAAFAYLGQGRDTDFVARQIVGVMMGFIPTLIGAVLNVLLEWRRDGSFELLRTALRGRQDVAAARAALAPAMRRAARMRPMPQLTWRTVREAHGLKGSDGREVALQVGDIVVLAIVSGTQQSLADGRPDRELMFGGMRTAAAPPTHACPGYEAGIATMLGCLAALLGRREALREGPLALSYAIEGATDCAPPAPALRALAPLDAVERALRGHALWTDLPQPGSRQGLVLAWGDSWLAYELGASFGWDLRDWLDNFGYRAPKTFCSWTQWGTLRAMAEGRAEFAAALEASITSTSRPRAVLLSGGGNDSTGSTLRALINPKGTAATVLDPQRVAAHVAQLRVHYVQLLSAIGVALKNRQAETLVPVLVHGYDHPLPAGQGLPFKKKWLWRPFVDAGYRLADGRIDLAVAAQAMRELIDALNTMLIGLQQSFAFVRHVDLRGTVAAHHAADQVAGWNDDLHPQDDMYKLMAAKLDSAID